MRRLDRAMFAIFLLALLADVARAHASVPAGDAGLILSAASQLQGSAGGEAILVLRHADGSPAQIAGRGHFRLKFAGWPGSLPDFASPMMLAAAEFAPDAGSGSFSIASPEPAAPSPSVFEHTGSPAP